MNIDGKGYVALVITAALAAATVSCGGGEGSGSTGDGGSAATSTSSAAQTGSGGSGGSGGGTGCAQQCSGKLACAPNSEFCSADAAAANCALSTPADTVQACGVPLGSSGVQIARSSKVKEYAGSGPPQIGCFAPAGYPAKPGASSVVKMSGVARIMSHGCQSKDVKVEVYTVKRGAGAGDGDLDQLVGGAFTTPSDCQASGVASDSPDCGTVYECQYNYAGVPTETELVIKTSGTNWTPVYEYNVYLSNTGVQNGAFAHDVQVLAADDYGAIAQAALGGPVSPGNGAVLGEVHDCGDVRLLQAIVDVDQPKKLLTYFTINEQNPLPDLAATATTGLGRYAALDVASGPVTVAATGLDAGAITTLGFTRAHVFPDSISLVTFHGLLPTQVP